MASRGPHSQLEPGDITICLCHKGPLALGCLISQSLDNSGVNKHREMTLRTQKRKKILQARRLGAPPEWGCFGGDIPSGQPIRTKIPDKQRLGAVPQGTPTHALSEDCIQTGCA